MVERRDYSAMVKGFKNMKLSLKNWLMLLSLTVVLPLLISINSILYSQTKGFLLNKMEFVNQTKLEQISSEVDDNLTQIVKIINYLNTNSQLINYIKEVEDTSAGAFVRSTASQGISKLLSSINENNELIGSIHVFTERCRYDSNDRIIADSEALQDILRKSLEKDTLEKIANSMEHGLEQNSNNSYSVDYSNKNIYFVSSIADGTETYGKVVIIIKDSFLKNQINNIADVALLDHEGNLIWKGDAFNYQSMSTIGKVHMDEDKMAGAFTDKKNRVYLKRISFNEWTIAYLYDMNTFEKLLILLRNLIIFAFGLSVFLAYLFSNLFSKKIFRPIEKLTGLIKVYGKSSGQIVRYKNEENRKIPLVNKVFYYLTISILFPIVFNIIVFHVQSKKIIEEQVSQAYYAMFTAAANKIDSFFDKKKTILKNIALNDVMQKYNTDEQLNNEELKSQLYEIIDKNIYLGLERDNIRIFNEDNRLILTNQVTQPPSRNSSFGEVIQVSDIGVKWDIECDKLNRYVLSLGLAVPDKNYSHINGYVTVDIDNIYISEQYEQLKTDLCKVSIFDENKNIISHSDIDKIGSKYTQGAYSFEEGTDSFGKYEGGSLIFQKKLKSMPWYFSCTYDYNDILRQTSVLLSSNIYLYIITFILIITISSIFSNYLLRPMNRLNQVFENVTLDTINEKAEVNSAIDEIETLGTTFNAMVERIEELFDELIITNMKKQELENGKREAELIALQAQINPHFLYNTLDTINYLIKENKREGAVKMITSLSNLFRIGISREEISIHIKDEMEYAKSYIDIISTRYGNKIKVCWNYDDALLEYKTIKLILQPVIENAIYHGIRRKNGIGNIDIACFKEEECIKFIIKDDGVGIPQNELRDIKESLKTNRNKNKIGIFNVHLRIQLYYGEKYGLEIDSIEGEGTKVTLSIPQNTTLNKIVY